MSSCIVYASLQMDLSVMRTRYSRYWRMSVSPGCQAPPPSIKHLNPKLWALSLRQQSPTVADWHRPLQVSIRSVICLPLSATVFVLFRCCCNSTLSTQIFILTLWIQLHSRQSVLKSELILLSQCRNMNFRHRVKPSLIGWYSFWGLAGILTWELNPLV